MRETKITQPLTMSEKEYWRLVFDREYNLALYKHVGCKNYRIVDLQETPREIFYTAVTEPDLSELPLALQLVVAQYAEYTERGVFNKASRIYSFRTTAMGGKIVSEGRMFCALSSGDKRPGGLTRTIEIRVMADVPFGGAVEDKILEGLVKSWQKGAEFTNRYAR